MGTRDWWLESSVENQSLLRPCPPVSGGARAQRYWKRSAKKIIKNFYHLFKNHRFPLFI